jgi:hypothetical protein
MKQITSKASAAFQENRKFRDSATKVHFDGITTNLFLHGHCIARKSPSTGLEINLCGWNTSTTRERLNGLPNVRIYTKKGQVYLNGNLISSNGWFLV